VTPRRAGRGAQRGQAVVLLAVGGVGMMAMAGLALDAGFEAGRYRVAQNAADAAALQDANQIFAAEIKHAAAPTLDQLEQTADKVIVENHAVPGRVSGGGDAGSDGAGDGTPTPPPKATTVTTALPPVWKAASTPSASAALISAKVDNTVSAAGVTTAVSDTIDAADATITARVPDVSVVADGTARASMVDNVVNESNNGVPLAAQSDSLGCSTDGIVAGSGSCSDKTPITVPSPLTVANIATVNLQNLVATTDAAHNPVLTTTEDLTGVDLGELGVLSVSGAARAQSIVVAGLSQGAVSVTSMTVTVTVPGVVSLSLALPSATIRDEVRSVGTGAYHRQQVWCGAGGSLTVTPAVGSPLTRPVDTDCSVASLPVVAGLTVLTVTPGATDAYPGGTCKLDGTTVCESGPGCIEHLVVTGATAGVDLCLGSVDARSTLVQASTYTLTSAPGTPGSRYTPSSAAYNGVTDDAYIDSPTFFLRVLGLTQTQPSTTASAQIQSVSDVPDADYTASPYAMPTFATPMTGTDGFGRLKVGDEYYLWGADMCSNSPVYPWCSGEWAGRTAPSTAGHHAVNDLLQPQSGVGSGPIAYAGSTGYVLMPVVDDVTGEVAYYGEFLLDSAHPKWGTLVNSDPAHGGHLVQAPSTDPYNPYGDGAATIRLTN